MTLGQSRRRTRRSSAFPHGNSSTKAPTVAPNWDETAWMDAEIPSSLRMPWSTWTHSSDLMPQLRSDGGRAYIAAAWTWRTRAPTVAPILGRTAWMDVEIPSSLRMPWSTWTHSSDLMAGVLIPLQPGLGAQERLQWLQYWDETAWMDAEIPSSLRMPWSTWTHSSDLMAGVLIPLQPGLGRTRAPTVAPLLGRNSLDGCGDTFLSTYALVNLDPQLRWRACLYVCTLDAKSRLTCLSAWEQ